MGSINGFSTAREMLAALDKREISALELLDLHLRRIERYGRQLNAIVIRCFEEARQAAQTADVARAKGAGEPLLGLPMTLKESINVRGLQTTFGMSMWADFRSEHNGAAAQRMQDAGAVLMGKTNVPPMLADWQADNAHFGRTNNPWDLTRTPGGSTGGGTAALAAGLTPLEVGSDIGGSIRVPAAFCGLYGHRPADVMILAGLDILLTAPYALRTSPIGLRYTAVSTQTKASSMPVTPNSHPVSLVLPEHTVTQLDELVRHGHFVSRQEAVVAAVDRLYADEGTRHLTTRQEAFARLCGALHLGTTRESLRQAELDRLAWESQHR